MVVYASNANVGGMKAGGYKVQSHPQPHSELEMSLDTPDPVSRGKFIYLMSIHILCSYRYNGVCVLYTHLL